MALTDAEKVSLKIILQLPQGGTIYLLSETGQQVNAWPASASVDSILDTALAALNAAQLTKLSALIAAWDALGTDSSAIMGGAIGPITGINDSPERERDEIRRQVQSVLPFVRDSGEYQRHRQVAIERG
jgi:hypothetical protein